MANSLQIQHLKAIELNLLIEMYFRPVGYCPKDMRIIEVTEHRPEWEKQYSDESAMLREIFGSNLSDIQHIGSTSVPGLKAKPTIDILITVHSLENVDSINTKMEDEGYKVHGEYGIPGRRFFSKVIYLSPEDWYSAYHVHVFHENDRYNIERHISLREYLIAHPCKAKEYGDLKSRLALKFPHDGTAYTEAKADFVMELEKDALEWYRKFKE